MGIVAVRTISRGRTVGNCSRNILEKTKLAEPGSRYEMTCRVGRVYVLRRAQLHKVSTMRRLDKHYACHGVIYKELRRNEDEDSCRGGPTKATTSLQQVVIDLFVCIK